MKLLTLICIFFKQMSVYNLGKYIKVYTTKVQIKLFYFTEELFHYI